MKTKLNRRQTVDEIRNRVDAAVRRSQREVDERRSPRKTSAPRNEEMAYRHLSNERHASNNARASGP